MVSQIISPADDTTPEPVSPLGVVKESDTYSLSDILKRVEEIKLEIAASPIGLPEEEQEAVDRALLQQVITLGETLGKEAERRSNFNRAHSTFNIMKLDALYEKSDQLREIQLAAITEHSKKAGKEKFVSFFSTAGKLLRAEQEIFELHKRKFPLNKRNAERGKLLAQAYHQVLGEIRPLGAEIKCRKNSNPIARKILQSTVGTFYPAEWIRVSNERTHPLALRYTRRGGYYQPKDENELMDEKGRVISIETWEVPIEELTMTQELLSVGDNKVWVTDAPVWEYMDQKFVELNFYSRFRKEDKYTVDGEKLAAKTSEERLGYVFDENEETVDPFETFQHGYIKGSEKDGMSPVLNIGIFHPVWEQKQTAYHEFMHHMQNILPETVRRLERAFFVYRTTIEGQRAPLLEVEDTIESMSKTSEVFYRAGDFADPYMGREYPFSHDLEIVTTGAEAIFGNAYGSLMGFHGHLADIEHRDFMLGLLAVG